MQGLFLTEKLCNVTISLALFYNLKYTMRVRKGRNKAQLSNFLCCPHASRHRFD